MRRLGLLRKKASASCSGCAHADQVFFFTKSLAMFTLGPPGPHGRDRAAELFMMPQKKKGGV
jgi:hypothetical protein